jgi:V/A-type H+-transporting ATPase subunit I
MFLPESMSRIVIVGANSGLDETIEVLYELESVHLIDHTVDADEGFTLGTPRPYSSKTTERLLKVRAMEKDLGINKHTKTQPISESEIRSQISSDSVETIEDEVRAILDRRNDLNQRITELNAKKKNLELLARLPIDLDLYSGYKSIGSMVGTVDKDPTQALAGMGEVFVSMDKKGASVAAVFVKNDDKSKAQTVLSECGFSEISVPEAQGSPKTALVETETQLEVLNKELAVVEKETEVLFEKHKHFLRASDEELTVDAEKGTLPIRIATTKYSYVIDAWVPTPKVDSVKSTIESRVPCTYVEIEENRGRKEKESEEKEERFKTVPTRMKHGRITKHFEYPTKMMSVPKYNEVDPTTLIAVFLPIFFGFMVGDIGYAIPFIILGAYGLRYAKNPDWRAIATVLFFGGIWAAIFGFFFFGEALGMHFVGEAAGVEYTWQSLLGLENLDKAFWWLMGGHGVHKISAEYVGMLLKLSVYVGIVHLTIGYLLAIYNKSIQYGFKHGFLEKGGAFLTFVGLVFICYAVATNLVSSSPLPESTYMGFIGVGAVILIIGIIINAKAEGAMKVVIELPDTVGNILSYTRLVAIGMSKAGMALAFNYIAIGMIAGSIDGVLGIIIGFIAFAFFQLMIWTLGIMSAGLHALRLQLVEFMVRFYEGDGIEFSPLKFKRNKIISNKNVKEA